MALPPSKPAVLLPTPRRVRMWCLFALLSVLATSCYSIDANVVVNEDGSGSFAIEYIIEKDTSEPSLIAGDLVAPCDAVQVMQNAAPAGSIFTPLESSSQCGARIVMEFANETEMVEGLRTVSDRSRFAGFGYFPDISVTRGDVDGAWNFQSQFKPPLPANLDAQTDFRNEVSGGSFVFSVDLPGRQVEHNADRIDENGVMIFEVNPLVDPSGQMFVQTEPGAKILGVGESSSFPLTTVLFVLVALAAIAGAVFILNRSKRRRQYEGEDDDDDSMVSASERLGLGSSAPVPNAPAVSKEASQPVSALFVDDAVPEDGHLADAPFDGAGPATESWPAEPLQDSPSPVFDAPAEIAEPNGWVSASQAIEGEPALADAQGFVAPQSHDLPYAAPDAEGWPAEPVVASASVPQAPSIIVDHSTDGISAVPASAGFPTDTAALPAIESVGAESAEVSPADSVGWPSVGAVVPVEPFAVQEATDAHVPFSDNVAPASEVGWPEAPLATSAPVAAFDPASVEPSPAPAPAPVSEPVQARVEQVAAAPSQADMVWDQQRNAYVVYDHRRSSWMVFDDAAQAWTPIS